jgi:hypothetical protein
MKIEIEITDTELADAICAGIEGGINYWCDSYRDEATPEQEQAARAATDDKTSRYWQYLLPLHGGALYFKTHDDGDKEFRLDGDALRRAVQIIAKECPRHLGDLFEAGNGDADTGDTLIQCAIFGETVYG